LTAFTDDHERDTLPCTPSEENSHKTQPDYITDCYTFPSPESIDKWLLEPVPQKNSITKNQKK